MLPLSQQISKAVGAHRAEMAEFTRDLVRIPTENPPGRNYRACAEVLARMIRGAGLRAIIAKIPPPKHIRTSANAQSKPEPRYWVRATFGSGKRAVYFHGHYDVVPASSLAQFHPRDRNGNVFGRGSADMKGGLVAMLYAARVLKELRVVLAGRIELAFVPDEETGGQRGTSALFKSGALAPGAIGMLTAEPTGGPIWNASRGAITMRVIVKGKTAHVGLSFRGVNAFERMLVVARALEKEKQRISARKTKFRIEPAAARRSILLLGGRTEGGTNFNAVPAECSFTVDRRINPEEDLATEKNRLLAILNRLRRSGIQMQIDIFQEGNSVAVRESQPLARALAKSIQEITRRAPQFEMCPGMLETRFYAQRNIPALACGPGLLSVSHGPNEFVSLREMEHCAAVYALTAVNLLGGENQA
jgi:acetylornithine deacetylase/succinyl-diaminopimelate desuccinylase family protein